MRMIKKLKVKHYKSTLIPKPVEELVDISEKSLDIKLPYILRIACVFAFYCACLSVLFHIKIIFWPSQKQQKIENIKIKYIQLE